MKKALPCINDLNGVELAKALVKSAEKCIRLDYAGGPHLIEAQMLSHRYSQLIAPEIDWCTKAQLDHARAYIIKNS